MAESPAAVFIGEGEELEAMIPMDGGKSVDPLAVQLRGQGGFAQAGGDVGGNIKGRHAVLILVDAAIR